MPSRPLFKTRLQRDIALKDLKVCPLCGSLNASRNKECHVCAWHGSFEKDPHLVEEALNSLVDQSPQLLQLVNTKQSLNIRQRILSWFRKRLDIWA
ncbi:MAG TPA: hypothetical protein PKA27_02720 [Fimbriimonadaceae bacterium]|nr:hypothetical protein [Fimbriimonadaceae bacterium]